MHRHRAPLTATLDNHHFFLQSQRAVSHFAPLFLSRSVCWHAIFMSFCNITGSDVSVSFISSIIVLIELTITSTRRHIGLKLLLMWKNVVLIDFAISALICKVILLLMRPSYKDSYYCMFSSALQLGFRKIQAVSFLAMWNKYIINRKNEAVLYMYIYRTVI